MFRHSWEHVSQLVDTNVITSLNPHRPKINIAAVSDSGVYIYIYVCIVVLNAITCCHYQLPLFQKLRSFLCVTKMAFVECVKCPSFRTPFLDPSEIVPGNFKHFPAWTHFAHFGTPNIKCLVQTIWKTPLIYTVGINSNRNDCRYDEWCNLQFAPQIRIFSLFWSCFVPLTQWKID